MSDLPISEGRHRPNCVECFKQARREIAAGEARPLNIGPRGTAPCRTNVVATIQGVKL